MAELAALNVKITGDASGIKAAANTATKSVESFTKSAESSAKVFERAFAQNERSVDRLRRAIDPVYAASKKYESAVNTLDKALKQGGISQATHTRLIEQANAAYLRAGTGATKAAGSFALLGNMSNQNRARIQNLGFQLQDVAVQLQAGTRESVVFAQQGSQIASIFGPVGAIIGTLAAVGIPLLAFAFANGAEEARKMEDALSDIRDLSNSLKAAQDILGMSVQELRDKYGQYASAVHEAARQLANLQAAQAQVKINEQILEMDDVFRRFTATANTAWRSGTTLKQAYDELKTTLGLNAEQAARFESNLRAVRDAMTFEERQAALSEIGRLLEEAGVSSTKIPPELRQLLIDANNATIAVAELANQMERAGAAAAGMTFGIGLTGNETDLLPPSAGGGKRTVGGGVGGGVAKTNPLIAELESVRQALLTQEEAQLESYMRQQETLRSALEQRLITQQEYQAMMEDAQRQHAARMSQIDAYRYGDNLQRAGAFFGDMANAFKSGNEKMAKIGQKFAAIEALINAWRAYNQTLADPSLPFFAKFAAAASVLAAGMNAVSAIKGGGKGGGGGAAPRPTGGGGGGGGGRQRSTYFNISLTGGDNFGKAQVRDLISAINKAVEDGAVIKGIRAT